MAHLTVNTSRYTFAHGKTPRGKGFWFFALISPLARTEVSFYGSYGETLKSARKAAQEIGAYEIVVLD